MLMLISIRVIWIIYATTRESDMEVDMEMGNLVTNVIVVVGIIEKVVMIAAATVVIPAVVVMITTTGGGLLLRLRLLCL